MVFRLNPQRSLEKDIDLIRAFVSTVVYVFSLPGGQGRVVVASIREQRMAMPELAKKRQVGRRPSFKLDSRLRKCCVPFSVEIAGAGL